MVLTPALTQSEATCPDGKARENHTWLQGLGCDFTTFCSTFERDALMPAWNEKRALGLLVHSARNTPPDTEMALMFYWKSHAVVTVPMTPCGLGWHCRVRRWQEEGHEQRAMDVAWYREWDTMVHWNIWNTLWAPESCWAMDHHLLPSCHSSALRAIEITAQRTRQSQLDFLKKSLVYFYTS